MANVISFLDYPGYKLNELELAMLVHYHLFPDTGYGDLLPNPDYFGIKKAHENLLHYELIHMSEGITKEEHDAGCITWFLSERGEAHFTNLLDVQLPKARIVWTKPESTDD